jgi:RimJ/RimL family protein N-acetyltransferase
MADAPGQDFDVERDGYRYVPLRREDIEPLRGFRNAQMVVLRQSEPISPEQQQRWFDEVVAPAQVAARPSMILTSILDGEGRFIGYGGLTNISWESRRAEVSFLVDPERAAQPDVYRRDMAAFLGFLAHDAFGRLGLNRLFAETYAFRDFHLGVLEGAGFVREGRLREHVLVGERLEDSLVLGLLAAEVGAR